MNADTQSPLDRLAEEMRRQRLTEDAARLLKEAIMATIVMPEPTTAFFNSILLRLDQTPDWSQPTGSTDGKLLKYNPEFVCSLTPGQREWFLYHEALHVGLGHHGRVCGLEDMEVAQIAADLVTNQFLKDGGLNEPPAGVVFPGAGEYSDLPTEADFETYYEMLLKKKQGKRQQEEEGDDGEEEADDPQPPGEGDGGPGEGEGEEGDEEGEGEGVPPDAGEGEGEGEGGGDGGGGPPPAAGVPDPGQCGAVTAAGDGSPAAAAEAESDSGQMLAEALSVAKAIGTLPGFLAKMVDAKSARTVDWRAQLRDWLTRKSRDRLSWRRPRAWALAHGRYLPGRGGRTLGKVVWMIDTSGSCWSALETFAAQMRAVCEEFPSTQLLVVYCDAQVNEVQEWDPRGGEPFRLRPAGGGGTSHVPAFDWVLAHHPDADAVVAFTDLYTVFPPAPPIPTLWAVVDNPSGVPPFGEVIRVPRESP